MEFEKGFAPSSEQLAKLPTVVPSRVDGRILVTQIRDVPNSMRQLQASKGPQPCLLRAWGSSRQIARGTGNGKSSSTEPQDVPSQQGGPLRRREKPVHMQIVNFGVRRYLRCGSPSCKRRKPGRQLVGDGVVALSFFDGWLAHCMRRAPSQSDGISNPWLLLTWNNRPNIPPLLLPNDFAEPS